MKTVALNRRLAALVCVAGTGCVAGPPTARNTNRAIRQRSDARDTDLRSDPGIMEGRGHADRRPRHIMARRLLFRPLRADRIACWPDANGCSGLQACAIAVDEHRSVLDVIGQLHREHASKDKLA